MVAGALPAITNTSSCKGVGYLRKEVAEDAGEDDRPAVLPYATEDLFSLAT